jgi:hypothetical protein
MNISIFNKYVLLLMMQNYKKSISMGISLPQEIVSKIDIERGDIPRSRFVLRILQQFYCPPAKKNIAANTATISRQAPKQNEQKEVGKND